MRSKIAKVAVSFAARGRRCNELIHVSAEDRKRDVTRLTSLVISRSQTEAATICRLAA